MTLTSDSTLGGPASVPRSPLVATLPLIVLTGALFTGSYLSYLEYRRIGPDNFPIWGLLLTLSFVAAIGAVVSWFFATDESASTMQAGAGETSEAKPIGRGTPPEFGRPMPEATAAGKPVGGLRDRAAAIAQKPAAPPWDEDVLPPVAARGPRPVLTTLEDPGNIARVLEEISDIQRDLAARQLPARTSAETPTRA
jgi:hypothetical protein